jgi:hypothetical protein
VLERLVFLQDIEMVVLAVLVYNHLSLALVPITLVVVAVVRQCLMALAEPVVLVAAVLELMELLLPALTD